MATATEHATKLETLQKNLDRLSDTYAKLGNGQDIRDLIEFIRHRPGWTTIAELRFANAIATSMTMHLNAVSNLKNEFREGCREVGTD